MELSRDEAMCPTQGMVVQSLINLLPNFPTSMRRLATWIQPRKSKWKSAGKGVGRGDPWQCVPSQLQKIIVDANTSSSLYSFPALYIDIMAGAAAAFLWPGEYGRRNGRDVDPNTAESLKWQ